MQTDTQTQEGYRPLPPSAASGIRPFAEPDLNDIVYAGKPSGKAEVEAAMRILTVRREVMDRVYSRRDVLGRAKRHEGEALECASRLSKEGELTPWQRLDLEGRRDSALAKMEYCREKARQYEMEVAVWLSTLKGGTAEG